MTDTSASTSTSKSAAAPLGALKPLLPYGWRYRGRVAAALAALTAASAATLTIPIAVRRLIDHGFTIEGAGLVNNYFSAMIAVVLVLAVASATRYYFVTTIGERVVADLRRDLFAHLAGLDAAFFDRARTGELVSRLTADTTQLKAAFGSSASIALRNLFMFAGAMALMVWTSAKLSALVVVAIPVIVLPLVASGHSVRRRSRRAQDALANATAFAAESLAAVRTMQASTAEAATLRRFSAAAEEAYDAARDATAARAWLTGIIIALAFSSVIGVLWLGARDVLAGRITGGLLSQFVLFAVLGASALGELSQVWTEVSAAAGAAARIADLLAERPRVLVPPSPARLPSPMRGALIFEHVGFEYPGAPHAGVLRDVSFAVAPGERVAIVGPSGAGKSTIIQLLLRFYDPGQGRILVDGVDIRSLDPQTLRRSIASVPQDPAVFASTVADNIAYGTDRDDRPAVEDAARQAAADLFIRDLSEGYDTVLGERGVTLSGGQRQRLAIARAIMRDAPILLLDEATSALDAANERLVQTALDAVMRDRTTLVIAHRLATVVAADRILVMDNGRIVEQGTHAALVARGGLYARLAQLQFETPAVSDTASDALSAAG